ncbi:MAG: dihydroorotase [Armatimonadetes bacterium]|nr:dihydroorotase [Armatimonadota bacterium]
MSAPTTWLIRGGRLIDPAFGLDAPGDLLIIDGCVAQVGEVAAPVGVPALDAAGMVVAPGLIDIHVHLREPGFEAKETLKTGCRAGTAGGFTAVCAMPNTRPVIDRPERVADLLERAASAACRVYPIGAATLDNRNEEFADFVALREAGCVAITDDAFPLQRSDQMAEALLRAAEADLPFIAHCELTGLSAGGSVDASAAQHAPGIATQATLAEAAAIRLWAAAYERAAATAPRLPRLHLAHVSSALGVEALRSLRACTRRPPPTRDSPVFGGEAAENWDSPNVSTTLLVRPPEGTGCRISAETAPHYVTLDSSAIAQFGANAKMNPPLRSPADVSAIREALVDGTIDLLATDHAPHTSEEKALPLDQAPFGIIGLETALAVSLSELSGALMLPELLARMSTRPAQALGLAGGSLQVGAPADVVVFDPQAKWTVDPQAFLSKGRNCPFAGREVYGRVWTTFVGGTLHIQATEGD